MPSKRGSRSNTKKNETQKRVNSNKNKVIDDDNDNISDYENIDDDVEEFQNSEDEYASQSGGETGDESAAETSELGDDNSTIDIDPDDEDDPIEDDKYDPVNENEEIEDPDNETDIEEDGNEDQEVDEEVDEEIAEEGDGEEEYAGDSKPCHMKNLNKDFIVLDEDDSNMYGKMEYKKILDIDRETDPVMTYYEMVRIIGTRAQQFNFGAEPLVKGISHLPPPQMAYIELIAKMTPFIIKRRLPGKKYEEWRVDELEIIHVISDEFFKPDSKFNWDALMRQADELNKMKDAASSENASNKLIKKSSKTTKSKK